MHACMQLRSSSQTLLAYVMPVIGGLMLLTALWALFLSPVGCRPACLPASLQTICHFACARETQHDTWKLNQDQSLAMARSVRSASARRWRGGGRALHVTPSCLRRTWRTCCRQLPMRCACLACMDSVAYT
jgi:hypothetical protein